MPPKRAAAAPAPAPQAATRLATDDEVSKAPNSPAREEKGEEAPPTTPPPVKRRLIDRAVVHAQHVKRSPTKVRGVRLTKYLEDGELVAFSIEGSCVVCDSSECSHIIG